jgi:hypothetical protein
MYSLYAKKNVDRFKFFIHNICYVSRSNICLSANKNYGPQNQNDLYFGIEGINFIKDI